MIAANISFQFSIFIIDGFADLNLRGAAFGEGSGPINMDNLGCSGTEYKLIECSYENSTDRHNEDWSVTCKNGNLLNMTIIKV